MPLDYSIPLQGQVAQFEPLKIMGDMTRLHAQRQENEINQMRMGEFTRERTMKDATMKALQGSGGDPSKAISTLRSQGYWEAADSIDKTLRENRKAMAEEVKTQNANRADGLGQVTQIMQAVKSADGYKAVLPTVRSILEKTDPNLLSQVKDEYDPEFVSQATTWGMKASEYATIRKEAAEALEKLAEQPLKEIERHNKYLAEGAKYLSTVDTPEEWTDTINGMHEMGFPAATLEMLGHQLTPDNVEQVKLLAGGKQLEPGTFGSYLTQLAKERKVDVTDLSTQTIEGARQRWSASDNMPRGEAVQPGTFQSFVRAKAKELGVAPSALNSEQQLGIRNAWGAEGASLAQIGAAERWKEDQLARIRRERAADLSQSVPAEFWDGEMRRVEESYRKQLPAGGAPAAPRSGGSPIGPLPDIFQSQPSRVAPMQMPGPVRGLPGGGGPPQGGVNLGSLSGRGPAPSGPPPQAQPLQRPQMSAPRPSGPPAPPMSAQVDTTRMGSLSAPPAPARPFAPVPQSPPMRPEPSSPRAAAPAAAPSAPDQIVRLLEKRAPGQYDLADGSSWFKDPTGSIRQLKPAGRR
ncbi:MAG: hypothetical protein NUW22_04825 [Acidobacteria bacterium]|nr:hypothetical protein [Acidobacteriota bacterium]